MLPLSRLLALGQAPAAPDKEMSLPRLAAGDAHELVKLEHAPLAAGPAFGAFMKDGLAGMVGALLGRAVGPSLLLLLLPARGDGAGVGLGAASAPTAPTADRDHR